MLWTVTNDQRDALPSEVPPSFRVKALGSVPHLQILAHPYVRVVVSHCGMASAQEALYHNIPVLCIPFFCDQPDVSARIVDSGAGMQLDKRKFDAEEVRLKVVDLEQNQSFAANAREVGTLLRQAGGTRRAASIIESQLAVGTTHLNSADLPFHKLVGADIFAVFAAVVCVASVSLRSIYSSISYFATRISQEEGVEGKFPE